jgi:hypothetical protein
MHSLLKSAVLGAGLLMAVTAAAQAQSVATLPPTSAEPAPTAAAPTFYSAKVVAPNAGTGQGWKEEHYTAVPADNDPARHPYSAAHFGPAPN